MKKWLLQAAWVILLGVAAAIGLYFLPPVHERLAWRVDNLVAQAHYLVNPPEKAVFVPQQSVSQIVQATLQAALASPTPLPTQGASLTPTLAPSSSASPAAEPTATATLQPTAIPATAYLNGIVHEYQGWNNCGPATLSMALTYWGWKGDQKDTAAYMKPNPRDKNVMPYEMADYAVQQTGLKALVRIGGDVDILKRLIASGFPVIVEKGFEPNSKEGWMGHYGVLNGYDDAKQRFISQDAYIMPNFPVPYKDLERNWRAFNYIYVVIYPASREEEVMAVLGTQADETANAQSAAQKASNEIPALTGRDLYFAWYNRGSSLVALGDYGGAAQAFDQAFNLYPSIEEKKRPWRMLWYQTGPYFAYFYTGRYADVINLANTALGTTNEPALEESFVWRARAEAASGNPSTAVDDLRTSLKWHPNFAPALGELASLGEAP